MKKVRKNQWKKVIGLLMTITLCTGSMDMTPVQATELQEEQQIQISNDMSEIIVSENSVSGITVSGSDAVVGEEQDTEAVYETDNARITLTVVSAWDTAWQAQVTIENTGDMAIEDWSLRLPLQQEIKSIWNAQVVQTDEIGSEEGEKDSEEKGNEQNSRIIQNLGWNQDIPAGGSVEFGFLVEGSFEGLPRTCELTDSQIQVSEANYDVTYEVVNNWQTGFMANIILTNTSDTTIRDWQLSFDFASEITSLWNGEIPSHEEEHYSIKNPGYSQNLTPGETITIGIVVSEGNPDNTISNTLLEQRNEGQGGQTQEPVPTPTPNPEPTPTPSPTPTPGPTPVPGEEDIAITIDTSVMEKHPNIEMYMVDAKLEELTGELTASEKVETLSFVTEDMNGTVVDSGELSAASDWVIEEPGLVIGVNKLTIIAEAKETDNITTNKTYSTEIYIMNFSQENMDAADVDLTDTDGDGINNYTESIFGTDPDAAHSDEDGIDDLQEITLTGTDPLKTDTDENGISDNEEDFDEDGLTAEEELEAGTQIFFADSDGDGLGDGEEVKSYGTDPVDEDTDDDTLTDGQEIELGTNPLSPDSDNDGIKDAEEITPQTYTEEIDTTERNEITKVSVTMDSAGHIENEMYILDTYNLDMRSTEVVGLIGVPVDITSYQEFDNATITFHYDEASLTTTEDNLGILWYDEENDKYILVEDVVLDAENNTISCETDHFSTWLVVNKEQWKQCWANAVFDPAPVLESTYPSYTVELEDGFHRYQVFEETSWADATQSCKLAGGHIVSIETNDEYIKVCNYLTMTLEEESIVGIFKPMQSYGMLPARWIVYKDYLTGNQSYPAIYFDVQYFVCEWELGEDGALTEDTTTDTDGDGLPDYYEKKGFLLSNGTVVYTKPDKADSDNDGVSDYDEVGGLPVPETFDIDGITYNVMVNYPAGYHKLSEEFIYVDGRVNANGMVIDSKMEYVPYSNSYIEDKYIKPIPADFFGVYRTVNGAANIHNSYIDVWNEMSDIDQNVKSLFYFTINQYIIKGSTLASMDYNAYHCMKTYLMGNGGSYKGLDEAGTREYIMANNVIAYSKFNTNSSNKCFEENLSKAMKSAESILNEQNREIYISLSPNSTWSGCSYVQYDELPDDFTDLDTLEEVMAFAEQGVGTTRAIIANISGFGIYNASDAGITVHCTYDPDTKEYSMEFIYYLIDFYDYSALKFLYEQDAVGLARSYELYGYAPGTIRWNKGDVKKEYVLLPVWEEINEE